MESNEPKFLLLRERRKFERGSVRGKRAIQPGHEGGGGFLCESVSHFINKFPSLLLLLGSSVL